MFSGQLHLSSFLRFSNLLLDGHRAHTYKGRQGRALQGLLWDGLVVLRLPWQRVEKARGRALAFDGIMESLKLWVGRVHGIKHAPCSAAAVSYVVREVAHQCPWLRLLARVAAGLEHGLVLRAKRQSAAADEHRVLGALVVLKVAAHIIDPCRARVPPPALVVIFFSQILFHLVPVGVLLAGTRDISPRSPT
jgi:hypothetical protein